MTLPESSVATMGHVHVVNKQMESADSIRKGRAPAIHRLSSSIAEKALETRGRQFGVAHGVLNRLVA